MNKTNQLPKLYLASNSPRRQSILRELGVPFTFHPSPYQECMSDVENLEPAAQASKLASLKAFHAASDLLSGIVIGADTIVVSEGRVMGKPEDRNDAIRMLQSLSGKVHQVITGVALVSVAELRTVSHSESTNVHFRKLTNREINHYADTPEPYDKAGAYAIQGLAGLFVEKISGCYYNVVGFPLAAFYKLLKDLHIDLFDYIGGPK